MSEIPADEGEQARDTWLAKARDVAERSRALGANQVLLFELSCLLQCAPKYLRQKMRAHVNRIDNRYKAIERHADKPGVFGEPPPKETSADSALDWLVETVAAAKAVDATLFREIRRGNTRAELCAAPKDSPFHGRRAWMLRRLRPLPKPVREQKVLAEYALEHYRFIPTQLADGTVVRVKRCSAEVDKALAQSFSAKGGLSLYAGIFDDGVETVFDFKPGPPSLFRVNGLSGKDGDGTDTRRAAAIDHVETARSNAADVLVLPEYTITPQVRERLLDHLAVRAEQGCRPILLVPGSFHEDRGDGRIVNFAGLYDWHGNELISHRKHSMLSSGGFVEDIEPGNTIEMLNTEVGLFALAICLDFCEGLDTNAWTELDIDWTLVPSYAPTATTFTLHQQRASAMNGRYGTAVVVAQQSWPALAKEECFPGSALVRMPEGAKPPLYKLSHDAKTGSCILAAAYGPALCVPAV